MKKHAKILFLALCCALLLSSTVSAATSYVKTIQANYVGVKLVVDGNPVTPKDADGIVVEPFIYEGTTYLPVRAVGEALGKQVSWDGNTKTVYIGEVPGQETYLLDVCPPYETGGWSAIGNDADDVYKVPNYFNMMGSKYFHGFELMGYKDKSYAYFNFNGKYSTLEFDFGHVDGTKMQDASFVIYLDGEYIQTIEGTSDMTVQHINIPLNHALQMKIICESGYSLGCYGFAHAVLN